VTVQRCDAEEHFTRLYELECLKLRQTPLSWQWCSAAVVLQCSVIIYI